MSEEKKDWGKILKEITEVYEKVCTGWEIDFIDSVVRQYNFGRDFSAKQITVVEKIYKRVCDSKY